MMNTPHRFDLGSTLAALVLGTLVASSPALAGGDKLEAQLLPAGTDQLASGKAKWEQRTDRTRASVQVEDIQQADRPITIKMCDAEVTVNLVNGFADFNADSRVGEDMVPTNCIEGNLVTVEEQDGTPILQGQLVLK